jgi:hypothetical protein
MAARATSCEMTAGLPPAISASSRQIIIEHQSRLVMRHKLADSEDLCLAYGLSNRVG